MLRWLCGVTKLDGIRNERSRGTVEVTEISKKIHESRLQWYCPMIRRDDANVGKGPHLYF